MWKGMQKSLFHLTVRKRESHVERNFKNPFFPDRLQARVTCGKECRNPFFIDRSQARVTCGKECRNPFFTDHPQARVTPRGKRAVNALPLIVPYSVS